MNKILLSVDEMAELLSIGRSKAYALVQDGTLPSLRIGRSVRIPLSALEDWVEQQYQSESSEQSY